jgi:tripartite-type tricarboxylate transporter receptor subunit TctC
VVIENRPGATGTMAAGQVAKSASDGYTIMMGHVSVNAIAPSLFSNLSYDVIKDFAPIGIAAAVPHFVTVHPSVQVSSLKELISYLKAKPDLTFPSAGKRSMPHLAGEIFANLAGVKMVHVLTRGPASRCRISSAASTSSPSTRCRRRRRHVRSGKLRALATSSAARLPAFPTCRRPRRPGLRATRSRPGTACSRPPARRPGS